MVNGENKLREAIAALDIVSARRVASILRDLRETWPGARNDTSIFGASIDATLAAIGEQQKSERLRWLDVN